ncbi:MAG: mechanosensitive ion channel [Candidatus Brocadiaceae bacterium]|nr:mechanosensitive ion channel [Candidatus Brocadiaceae bacterium]
MNAMKNILAEQRILFLFVVFSGCCLTWLGSHRIIMAQTPQEKEGKILLEEQGVIIKLDDLENARIKLEDVKVNIAESARKIEGLVSNTENTKNTTASFLEKLQQEKQEYQREVETNPAYVKLLDIEINILQEKFNVDNELAQVYKDQLLALQSREKSYAKQVSILEKITKLQEIVVVTPSAQATTVRNEANVAKGYIAAAQANHKEKETLLALLSKELEDVKTKGNTKLLEMTKELESLKVEIKDDQLVTKAQVKVDNILLWQKAVSAQQVAIIEVKQKTAEILLKEALLSMENAKMNAAFLTKKAELLEEKFKRDEVERKQEELKAAKKFEEITTKVVEASRAETEKTVQEAAEKGEKVVQEQLLTTSPEKKRVLELEAELHKHEGYIAVKKDGLITEDAQRYKDIAEYKKLEADIEKLLSSINVSTDIAEVQKKVTSEKKRFSDAKASIESLITSLKQEQKLLTDNFENTKNEINEVKKEVDSFEDKTLALQAIAFVRKKRDLQKMQLGFISDRLDRLQERLEIKQNALSLLDRTNNKLIEMEAANVWRRVKSSISIQTLQVLYKDIKDFYRQFGVWYDEICDHAKDFVSYGIKKNNTVEFWIRACGLFALLSAYYFSTRKVRSWCSRKIDTFYGTEDQSYCTTRLFPSLLIVLRRSVSALWLSILSLSIPALFHTKTPLIAATMCVLSFIAVHKVLKGFLVEAFSPEKGDRKLVSSLAYITPRHLYKSLNVILFFSLLLLSLITVLKVFHYRNDIIELFWFIYRTGTLILLLWVATQKTLILRLLPDAASQLGRIIHLVIKVIYPVFIGFIVLLFAIRSLGYPVLTYVLVKTCIKSFIAAFIAFWIWKFFYYRLTHVRDIRLKKENIQAGTPEEKRFHAVTAAYRVSFNYIFSIITAIIIIRVWITTFYKSIGSPAAPYLIREIFEKTSVVTRGIGRGLTHRLVFQEGSYTTPLKIVIALTVLFASFFLARYIKNLLEERAFQKLRLEIGLKQTFSNLSRYIIIGIAALIGLNLAGIPLRSLAFFAGAFGIGIGFGMQNVIGNFVSGIILLFERPMRVGDVITLDDGTLGTINRISTRSTTLTTPDNVYLTVPNSKFVEGRVINWSLPSPVLRGKVTVGVAYGSDTAQVKQCLLDVAKQNTRVRRYPEPFVRFDEFGDSALIFQLYYWANDPGERWFAMSELHFSIDETFRKNSIEIAFPQRDIHIRSMVPFKQEGNQKTINDQK